MKITSSSIAMSSSHVEASYTHVKSMTIEAAASKDTSAAILTLSENATGKSYMDSMKEYTDMQKKENEKKQKQYMQDMAEQMRAQRENNQFMPRDTADSKIKMLRRLLAILRGEKPDPEDTCSENSNVTDLRSTQFKKLEQFSFKLDGSAAVSLGSIRNETTSTGTTWQRITATSGFTAEAEVTTFSSSGIAKTADGRRIDFGIEVSMSRAFMAEINTLEVKEYIKTDPLIINLDSNVTSVSDQKFYFDLDTDGKKENISFAGKGSGFLALDRNGDGIINDGSELFGTKSGDGFKDLAAFDEDNNGWIDENDDIFNKLKVWTKDEDGNDYLINLKDADVGAIYLGNADTEFSLKNEEHELNAQVRKTGIYLRESTGMVGTVNHVDLVI